MKKIVVIGCSNSTGEEIRDWELDPNYYTNLDVTAEEWYHSKRETLLKDFFNDRPDLIQTSDPTGNLSDEDWNTHLNAINVQSGNTDYLHAASWNEYNDSFAWPALIDKNEEYEVHSFATRGVGLSYFELVYNMTRIPAEYDYKGRHISSDLYVPKPKYKTESALADRLAPPDRALNRLAGFKELCDTADILIWQITNEPRYATTLNAPEATSASDIDLSSFLITAHNQSQLQGWLETRLEGGLLKTVQDFYKYYYDNTTNFSRSLTWIEMLMQLREDRDLKNIIFPIHKTYTSRLGINVRNTDYTKTYGMDNYGWPDSGACPGILLQELDLGAFIQFDSARGHDNYTAKFTHPSARGHEKIAKWVEKIIKEEL